MCPHDEFEILYYLDRILIRRCKRCGAVQINLHTSRWMWRDDGFTLEIKPENDSHLEDNDDIR
jgi:hypothetical protein